MFDKRRRLVAGWTVLVLGLAAALAGSAQPTAAAARRQSWQVVVRALPSTAVVRQTVTVRIRLRRFPKGDHAKRVAISWGDHTRAVRFARLGGHTRHRYVRPGIYLIRVTITDARGQRETGVAREHVQAGGSASTGGGPQGSGGSGGGGGAPPAAAGPGLYNIAQGIFRTGTPGPIALYSTDNPPGGNTDVTQVADSPVGGDWLLSREGVTSSPTAVFPNQIGPPVQTVIPGVAKIAASGTSDTLLFLKTDGTVVAEGRGDRGQLGDGTSGSGDYATTPVEVSGLHNVVDIAVGPGNGYAVESDGTVWAWGSDDTAGLGWSFGGPPLGPDDIASTPRQVLNLPPIATIGMNPGGGAYALSRDGRVFAWGCPDNGALGGASNPDGSVAGLPAITKLTAAYGEVIAFGADGKTYFWGDNQMGAAANGTTGGSVANPIQIGGLPGAPISAAFDYDWPIIVGMPNGTIYAWGGIGATGTGPALVTGLPGPATVVGPGTVLVQTVS